jgi:hypothetical protein
MKIKVACLKCKSEKVKRILYGYPIPGKVKDDDILGGCVISDESPTFHCLKCENEW